MNLLAELVENEKIIRSTETPEGFKKPCALWLGALSTGGTPFMIRNKVAIPIRRLTVTGQTKTEGRNVGYYSKCGNKRCVEPTHVTRKVHHE